MDLVSLATSRQQGTLATNSLHHDYEQGATTSMVPKIKAGLLYSLSHNDTRKRRLIVPLALSSPLRMPAARPSASQGAHMPPQHASRRRRHGHAVLLRALDAAAAP